MDPVLAQKQVDNILTGFIRVDPIGKAVYEANAAKFKQGLAALHERFQRALSTCRGKIFITNHAAFGYFAARYGLTQIGIAGLAPDAEPSAAKIRELIRVGRQNDIQVIYYESLVSPRVAAEELHRRVRRTPHPIGLATVYRALETFVREGLVEPMHVGDGSVRYGLAAKHHDHLVCLGCGEWKPLRECLVPQAPRRVTAEFRITGHQLEIYGYCARCQASA